MHALVDSTFHARTRDPAAGRQAPSRSTPDPPTPSRSPSAAGAPIRVADAVFRDAHSLDLREGEDHEARLREWLESLTPDQLGKYKM